ncbi:myosin-binding protein 2 [Diospyros lotus]|uniref:myosin-binding protein 2 n=1 Tax=Diospyros lotus TaxID=55363 RepID=UPI0022547A7A|nr:myosin-binding protein 2 [Diospyros lotus]
MAANKFATMLHRNTNKMTLILIYAVLEWVLIILLLLNSLFTYLIIKFADYFGLKAPCLWCSRVDHIFEKNKSNNFHRDLLCEVHAAEISKLGYCSGHRKLAESQDMCEDCSSSENPKNLAFFPWIKEIGMIQSEGHKENGGMCVKCSCCGVSFERKIYSPCIVIKPSWGVLDYAQKENLVAEAGEDDQLEEGDNSDRMRSDSLMDQGLHENGIEEKGSHQMSDDLGERENWAEMDVSLYLTNSGLKGDEDDKEDIVLEADEEETVKEEEEEEESNFFMEFSSSGETLGQVGTKQDASVEIIPQHLEFFVGHDGCRLIPVELIDSTTEKNGGTYRIKEEEDDDHCEKDEANLGSKPRGGPVMQTRSGLGQVEAELSAHQIREEAKFAVLESMEIEEYENSLVFHPKESDFVREVYEHVETQNTSEDVYNDQETELAQEGERDLDVAAALEEAFEAPNNETEAEVSIGTEIPDLEQTDEFGNQETIPPCTSMNENPSTSFANFIAEDDHGSKLVEEEPVKLDAISVEVREHAMNNQAPFGSDLNEIEEEKVPDTPTSIESLHSFHKKLLLLERKESGTEDSLDGSVISEFEGGEGVVTAERLKSILRAERKALHALYAELEEERSANAVAANQTMAMINRLQEEKAAMQMEALQYQRMMEEQSEYDQEALQLLNELMVKREKEKQEVEKELEVYRKKVLEYEAKEKMRMLRKSKDCGNRSESSSPSSSNSGDSDGLSIDLNQEAKEVDSSDEENGNHNTPVEAVINLEESLVNFEEERLSILEQLKVLEEKLFTLSDEEETHFDIEPIDHFYEENGKYFNGNSDNGSHEVNGVANGFHKEMNGKHHQEGRIMGAKGRRLLPLFDAISAENEDVVENGHENGFDSDISRTSAIKRIELENKKHDVEEEVDHLYERLEALEADREFLKHCISSLNKGDKGTGLLQEILQHLRDLRNVELRVRNLSDGALV